MAIVTTLNHRDYVAVGSVQAFETVADMQASEALQAGMVAHTNGFHASGDGGAAYYTIGASGDISLSNNLYATSVNSGVKQISLDELATVGAGTYTLGTVQVDEPIRLSRIQNRNIIIVDTVFNINTEVLFPRTGSASYFVLPSFVGCTFNNLTNGRVLVASGDTNMVGSRITGCSFVNVDMVRGTYVQDFDFTSCYIQSCEAFLECANSTVQARFTNCNVESESKKIVVATRAVVYVNGVFEGNEATDWHFFEFTYGLMLLDGAWIEGTNFANITGSTAQAQKTSIVIVGSNLVASNNPLFEFTNTDYIYVYIFGSQWSAATAGSRICTNVPDDFAAFVGTFHNNNADTYNYPFGGVSALDREIATEKHVSEEIAKINTQYMSRALASSPISVTIPCGLWRVTVVRPISGGTLAEVEYLVYAPVQYGGVDTKVFQSVAPTGNDPYVASVSVTATKAATGDTTFSLEITATMAAAYHVSISKA